jgi:hypothetical protein
MKPFKKVLTVEEGQQDLLESNMRTLEHHIAEANTWFREMGLDHLQWSVKRLSPLSYELTYYGPVAIEDMTLEWMNTHIGKGKSR